MWNNVEADMEVIEKSTLSLETLLLNIVGEAEVKNVDNGLYYVGDCDAIMKGKVDWLSYQVYGIYAKNNRLYIEISRRYQTEVKEEKN